MNDIDPQEFGNFYIAINKYIPSPMWLKYNQPLVSKGCHTYAPKQGGLNRGREEIINIYEWL